MSFIDKHRQTGSLSNGGQLLDPAFQSDYPALFEYLALTRYPDGAIRQTASLTMFSEDGVWKACLNERETSQVLFVTESSFGVLLAALDLLLESELPPCRPSRSRSGPSSRGKK